MNEKLVYLCGPITGLSYDEARTGWRMEVATRLSAANIKVLSPLRYKNYLSGETDLKGLNGYADHALSTSRGITARDRYDTQRCDMVLCNLLGATSVSIGSMIELGWLDSVRTPVVVCMEEEGNPHNHDMVREIADFIVPTISEAVSLVKAVLTPGY